MKDFLKVVVFSLLTVGFFAGYSNFGIPRLEPDPPPEEEKFDLGSITMEQFIALGDRVLKSKGRCSLCHNDVGGRAPLLENVAQLATERLADPSYNGTATSVEEYLHESLVDPSAYVVPGYGKTGAAATESPMPDVSTPGIGLSEVEIKAVIAYLQEISGLEVTVEIPTAVVKERAEVGELYIRPPLDTAEEVVAYFTCGACHKMSAEEGIGVEFFGPDLSHIGAAKDREYLRRSILNPNADVPKGFEPDTMPHVYGGLLYAKELEILVSYLAGLK